MIEVRALGWRETPTGWLEFHDRRTQLIAMSSPDPIADTPARHRDAHRTPPKKELGAESPGIAMLGPATNGEQAQGLEVTPYSSSVVALAVGGIAGLTLADVTRITGVHAQLIRYYCRLGLLASFNGGAVDDLIFDGNVLEDIRRIEHYRYTLGVKRRALSLICELRREALRNDLELGFLETTWGHG